MMRASHTQPGFLAALLHRLVRPCARRLPADPFPRARDRLARRRCARQLPRRDQPSDREDRRRRARRRARLAHGARACACWRSSSCPCASARALPSRSVSPRRSRSGSRSCSMWAEARSAADCRRRSSLVSLGAFLGGLAAGAAGFAFGIVATGDLAARDRSGPLDHPGRRPAAPSIQVGTIWPLRRSIEPAAPVAVPGRRAGRHPDRRLAAGAHRSRTRCEAALGLFLAAYGVYALATPRLPRIDARRARGRRRGRLRRRHPRRHRRLFRRAAGDLDAAARLVRRTWRARSTSPSSSWRTWSPLLLVGAVAHRSPGAGIAADRAAGAARRRRDRLAPSTGGSTSTASARSLAALLRGVRRDARCF